MANMLTNAVSSLQNSVSNITEKIERTFSEIEQKLNSFATDRVVLENQNTNRSTSLFGQAHQISSFETVSPFSVGRSLNAGETIYRHFLHIPTRVAFLQIHKMQETVSFLCHGLP